MTTKIDRPRPRCCPSCHPLAADGGRELAALCPPCQTTFAQWAGTRMDEEAKRNTALATWLRMKRAEARL